MAANQQFKPKLCYNIESSYIHMEGTGYKVSIQRAQKVRVIVCTG